MNHAASFNRNFPTWAYTDVNVDSQISLHNNGLHSGPRAARVLKLISFVAARLSHTLSGNNRQTQTMDRLANIERCLSDSGYRVSRDVQLPDDGIAQIVASRAYLSWKGWVIQSQHILVQTINSPTVADMKNLFESGFRIGKKRNRVPLIRGLQFGYMIIPVVVANVVSNEVTQYVSQQPPNRWCLMEFPVVCDATSNETFYFKGTPVWGAFFFSDLRNVVAKHIE